MAKIDGKYEQPYTEKLRKELEGEKIKNLVIKITDSYPTTDCEV